MFPTDLSGYKLRVISEPEYRMDRETNELITVKGTNIPKYTVGLFMKKIPSEPGAWVPEGTEIQVTLAGDLPENIEDGMLVELQAPEISASARYDKFKRVANVQWRLTAAGIKPATKRPKTSGAAAPAKELAGASA